MNADEEFCMESVAIWNQPLTLTDADNQVNLHGSAADAYPLKIQTMSLPPFFIIPICVNLR
jgi:hypothetical protein